VLRMRAVQQIMRVQFRGWHSPFGFAHNYTQQWYLDQLKDTIDMHATILKSAAKVIRYERWGVIIRAHSNNNHLDTRPRIGCTWGYTLIAVSR
jgi:hypothetical protein